MLILAGVLLVLIIASIKLARSGYLPGRTYVGWAFLVIFLIFYLEFWAVWSQRLNDPFEKMLAVVVLGLLLATQGPLVLELVAQTFLGGRSRGLRLLKVHTEPERKVIEGDLPGAIAEYERIIAGDPEDLEARFRMAELCCENEQYRKAADVYEALLDRYARELDRDRHCSVLTRLSEIYARNLNDIHSARKYIKTIIETYPDTNYAVYAKNRLENL